VSGRLSYDLHVLVARMDRDADVILSEAFGLSYRRFLALLLVGELGEPSQRELAGALGVTEPSVSRMTGVLADEGLLTVTATGDGRRRRLALTAGGADVVERSSALLEAHFTDLLRRSNVPLAAYHRHTRALLAALETKEVPP
jgi:DNA-binding MarR family transcriptional regulator